MLNQNEVFNSALNPVEITYASDIYGQIEFDVWYCVLQKGVGKVVYDPGQHAPNQRRTAVKVILSDLGGNTYPREFIAEIATDGWAGVILPSLKALGVTDLVAFNGAYVHAEMVAYDTYKKSDGTEGKRTAPKVLAIFRNLDECAAAAQGQGVQTDLPIGGNGNGNGNGAAPANSAERDSALAFLPAIVKLAVRGNAIDSAALDGHLKGNPILNKYFNLGSPEVMAAIEAALAEPAF